MGTDRLAERIRQEIHFWVTLVKLGMVPWIPIVMIVRTIALVDRVVERCKSHV